MRRLKKALSNNIRMTGTKTDIILKAINEYLMELAKEQIIIAFEQSEKEVSDLHQRTREGMETARLKGKQIGRKRGTTIVTQKGIAIKEGIKKILIALHYFVYQEILIINISWNSEQRLTGKNNNDRQANSLRCESLPIFLYFLKKL